MTNVATRLRSETEQEHLALERALMPLAKGAKDAAGYTRMLQGMYPYLAAVEAKVLKLIQPATLPDKEARRNTDLMRQDLEALGAAPDAASVPQLPIIETEAQALGALYVLEGSTLGGQVVAQMLRKQLPEEAWKLAYFQSYGSETRAMWNQFREHLENYTSRHPEVADTLVEAATDTFLHFRQWLEAYKGRFDL